MNGLYLQYERAWRYWKDGYEVNVLCIVDQDHQRPMIAVNHFMKFKGI